MSLYWDIRNTDNNTIWVFFLFGERRRTLGISCGSDNDDNRNAQIDFNITTNVQMSEIEAKGINADEGGGDPLKTRTNPII